MEIASALIVDDSKMARITLKKQLEARDIAVYMAESGEESLEFLKSNKPDLIFMDCLMPGIDGYETTRRILSNSDTSLIPIVMCTGKESDEDKQKAFDLGATGYMTKSSSTDPLDAILKEMKQVDAAIASVPTQTPAASISAEEISRIAQQAASSTIESTLASMIDSEINKHKTLYDQNLNAQIADLTEKLEQMILFSVKSSLKETHSFINSKIEQLNKDTLETISEMTTSSVQTLEKNLQQKIDSFNNEINQIDITSQVQQEIQQQIEQDLKHNLSTYASRIMEDELSRLHIESLIQEKLKVEQNRLDLLEQINETRAGSSAQRLSIVAMLVGASALAISIYQLL